MRGRMSWRALEGGRKVGERRVERRLKRVWRWEGVGEEARGER